MAVSLGPFNAAQSEAVLEMNWREVVGLTGEVDGWLDSWLGGWVDEWRASACLARNLRLTLIEPPGFMLSVLTFGVESWWWWWGM